MTNPLARQTRSRERPLPMLRSLLAACLCCLCAAPLAAQVELPAIFGDHMVLQAGKPIVVWGRAAAGEHVAVELAGRRAETTATDGGEWRVTLPELPSSGPFELVVSASNRLVIEDVLIGEVWLGSGQSNMVMYVQFCSDYEETRATADLPGIRVFREDSAPAREPQWRGRGRWKVCSPETVGEFSGTLFYFGRRVHQRLKSPVGLVESAMSATHIQSWISAPAQLEHPYLGPFAHLEDDVWKAFDFEREESDLQDRLARWKIQTALATSRGVEPPKEPRDYVESFMRQGGIGGLFNGKIAPLIPYTLRGIVWYQGENNVDQAPLYFHQLPLLIHDWRARWGLGDLPFGIVQLPNFADGRHIAHWPAIREAQRRALALPRTGLAITIDLGQDDELHPPNKRGVGERLAAWALGEVYHRPLVASGPLFAGFELRAERAIASFTQTASGLVAPGGKPRGFELRDAAGTWVPAVAELDGERVIVSAPNVERPSGLRYGWANAPDCTLYNSAGMPAAPFSTADVADYCGIDDVYIREQYWNLRLK